MWNNNFTLSDLMMNPKMKGVFPQFGKSQPVLQVYSFAEQTRQVKEHLRGLLKATKASSGELRVKGTQSEVMTRVNAAKATIEQLFNSMPSISKNLRSGAKLYMPFATHEQVHNLTDFDAKLTALQAVVDNIKYNPDYANRSQVRQTAAFGSEQKKWQEKVGMIKKGEM